MADKYIRVKPKRELTNPTQITRSIAGLCEIGQHVTGISSLWKDDDVPTFECLIYSQGENEQIYFVFGVDSDEILETLKNAFRAAYPDSFDIDVVEKSFEDMVLPEMKYDSISEYKQQFGARIEDWNGTDIEELEITSSPVDDSDSRELRVADEQELSLPGDPVKVTEEGEEGLQNLVLAQPTIDDVDPLGIEWWAEAKRKKDWMTTMKQFPQLMEEQEGETAVRSPLAGMIQQLSDMKAPCAFQVLFKPKPSWSKLAKKRKKNLQLGRDTLPQKIAYEVSELIHGETTEGRRREKRRGPPTVEGEDATQDTSADMGTTGDRQQLIDEKHPQYTFTVNLRAVAIPTRMIERDELENQLKSLKRVFNDLGGKYYGFYPIVYNNRSERWLDDDDLASKLLKRMKEQQLVVDRRGNIRRSLVMNAAELANYIVVPSSKNLTVSGTRQTRAKPRTRNPLPRPDPDLMEHFHESGMRVGYALDELSQPEETPTQIPPGLLTTHYGRFATTGAGKSKAIQNDMISLYENTDGPVILIDPKGDGMAENFLRSFWHKYQDEPERLNDVRYFPIPEILPGFSFFDIRSDLARGERRVDAIQKKADGYEEILKLVMGREQYRESKVAPTIIQVLIKALFDKEHGKKNGRKDRESVNYFTHRDLEIVARELRLRASDDEGGKIPEVSDKRLEETLDRHLASNESDFATIMDAVFNRLDYIKQDDHLRRIFDNTEQQLDFDDFLHEKKVLLFDLGDLRDDASLVMTGLILTELWDTLNTAKEDDRDEDDIVNVIIDEAASVAVSNLMNKMLEKGRGFGLSVGLAMQFPGQMKSKDADVYRNVLNNMGSFLIGKIPMDEEVAEAVSNEAMDAEEFENRFKSLPRGEWIGQFPSPEFKRTGPEPFSLDPLPIPPGHPESDTPLTKPQEATFSDSILEGILDTTERECGVPENQSDGDQTGGEPADANPAAETETSGVKQPSAVSSAEPTSTSDETSSDSEEQPETTPASATSPDDPTPEGTAVEASGGESTPTMSPASQTDSTPSTGSVHLTSDSVDDTIVETPDTSGVGVEESRFESETTGTSPLETNNPDLGSSDTSDQSDTAFGQNTDTDEEASSSSAGELSPTQGGDATDQPTTSNSPVSGESNEPAQDRTGTGATPNAQESEANGSTGGSQPEENSEDGPKMIDGVEAAITEPEPSGGTEETPTDSDTSASQNTNTTSESEPESDEIDFSDIVAATAGGQDNAPSASQEGTEDSSNGAESSNVVGTISIELGDATSPENSADDSSNSNSGQGGSDSETTDAESDEGTGSSDGLFFPESPDELTDSDQKGSSSEESAESDTGSDNNPTGNNSSEGSGAQSSNKESASGNQAENVQTEGDESGQSESGMPDPTFNSPDSVAESGSHENEPSPESEQQNVGSQNPNESTKSGSSQPSSRDSSNGNPSPVDPTIDSGKSKPISSEPSPGESHTEHTKKDTTSIGEDVESLDATKTEEVPGQAGELALATTLPDSFEWSVVPPQAGYEQYGLEGIEAMFLRTIIDAYNMTNDYPLELPMSKHLAGKKDKINPKQLEEDGFLKRHYLLNQGHWYTPSSKAQKAVRRTMKAGERIGDRGEDMPHKLIAVLAKRYFESRPDVHMAKLYAPVGEGDDAGVIDVLAVDEDHQPVHIAEVEAGEKDHQGRWGTNNVESVVKDYNQLASVDAEAWWFVRNVKGGQRILNQLKNNELYPVEEVKTGPLSRNRDQIKDLSDTLDGIHHMYTLVELYNSLESESELTDE